ncbi:hypothetical protein [Vreelandella sp. GE22]
MTSTEQYRWGANGQLMSVTNEHGDVAFQYDDAQRLVGEQQRHAGIEGGSGWQWQQQHTLTANGAPQASQFGELPALNWHTYGSGHLHGLSAPGLNLEIDLEPDVLHRETQRRLTLASGDQAQPLILERGYTNLGQLDHLTLRGAQNGGGQQYQYDALGRMSFRSVQSDQASRVIAYSYDAAGRLTGSQHGDQAHRYALDAAGNRLDGQQAITDNRLDHLDGARHRFDGAGNMIEKQAANGDRLTLGYDGANRLVQLTRASERGRTVDATYRYDGLGRRVSKTVRHENGTNPLRLGRRPHRTRRVRKATLDHRLRAGQLRTHAAHRRHPGRPTAQRLRHGCDWHPDAARCRQRRNAVAGPAR